MLDLMTTAAQTIGFLVLLWIALAVFCMMVLTILFSVNLYSNMRASRYGKHVTSVQKLLKVPGKAELDKAFNLPENEQQKEQFDQEALEALRKKLTSPPEPEEYEVFDKNYNGPTRYTDQTEVYPPFSNQGR